MSELRGRTRYPGKIDPDIKSGLWVDLVAYWPFNNQDNFLDDASGNGNHLTGVNYIYNARSCKVGSGIYAETNKYAYIIDNTYLSTAANESISFSVWVYINSSTTSVIFGKNATGTNRSYRLGFDYTADDKLYWYGFNNGVASVEVKTAALSLNTWYHVYCYYDYTTGIGISLNNTAAVTAAFTTQANCTSNFTICRLDEGTQHYLSGNIDELCVWKRLLTTEEITALYNGGSGMSLL